MTVLVTRNPTIFTEISYTPLLEGSTPVAIGIPLIEGCENPRYAVIHPFDEITEEWITVYCSGESPSVEIMDSMPDDWVYPTPD